MLKKVITYTDYNGVERTEPFYFNLSKAELIEMETSVDGGLSDRLKKISVTRDMPKIYAFFKDIILKSYGEKSDDGRRFIKSAQLSEEFSQTEAYSNLYVELATDTDKGLEFINGIMPDGFSMTTDEVVEAAKTEMGADIVNLVKSN